MYSDYDGDMLTRFLVLEEHPISVRPHGDSKWKENFIRTIPSTLQKLNSIPQDLTPKFAVCEASHSSGGIALAPSVEHYLEIVNKCQILDAALMNPMNP